MKRYIGLKMIRAIPSFKEGKNGYEVTYPDSYLSWSPKDVFEEAYKPDGNLDYSHALYLLKKGFSVARSGWNGKGMWIKAQLPDDKSKMTLPYIYMKTADDQIVPWLASNSDQFAEDWMIISEPAV